MTRPYDHRESSRRQRAEALAAVEWNSATWRPWADLALYQCAAEFDDLTSDDVWVMLAAYNVPTPGEPRAMGPVMIAGQHHRWIHATDRFRNADNPATSRNHGRPQRVYRSLIVGAKLPTWPARVWPSPPMQARLFDDA